jgi:hypothetical protein
MARFLLLAAALTLAACQSDSEPSGLFDLFADESYEETAVDADGALAPVARTAQDQTSDPTPEPDEQRLIRRAEVRLRVDDYTDARERVGALVQQFDGYLGDEREQRYPSRIENTLTIRVDAGRFDSLMSALLAVGEEIDFRNVTVEDVTRQYVDLEARLRARRAVEVRYTELLARANDIEAILAIERQLAEVREQIESAEGQLRYLSNQVALSTITLTLFEESSTGLVAGPTFFSRIGNAFEAGWESVLEGLIALVVLWPLWVLIAVSIPLLRRLNRRLVTRRKTRTTTAS